MSKTEERLKVLDMIDYFKAGSSVAVAAGQPAEPHQRDPVRQEHRRHPGLHRPAEAPPGVSEQTCTSKGQPAINGVTLPNVQEALTQLHSKRIDGVLYDTTALAWARQAAAGLLQHPRAAGATSANSNVSPSA